MSVYMRVSNFNNKKKTGILTNSQRSHPNESLKNVCKGQRPNKTLQNLLIS